MIFEPPIEPCELCDELCWGTCSSWDPWEDWDDSNWREEYERSRFCE